MPMIKNIATQDNRLNSTQTRSTRALLASGFIGPLLFVAIFLIDGATRPGFNPFHHWISHLSLGERGWLGTLNLLLGGFSILVYSVGLRRVFSAGQSAVWGPRFVMLTGLGLLLAAVFPIDPGLGYPPGVAQSAVPSLTGLVHNFTGLMVFGSLTGACFVLARRFKGDQLRRGWWWYTLLTGFIVSASFLICSLLVGLEYSGSFPGAPSGLFERIAMICGCLWLAWLAFSLLQQRENQL